MESMAGTCSESFQHVDHPEIKDKLPYHTLADTLGEIELEQMKEHKEILDTLANKFRENWSRGLGAESFVEDTFMRSELRGCIFVGHVNTDLDSVAGAVCAAALYGGIPARAEENFNGEIEFALNLVGMGPPEFFDKIPGAVEPVPGGGKKLKICLVDHSEVDQMTLALKEDPDRMKRIIGLIDHHAVAASFATVSPPAVVDIRAWGSMCTIVFHMYLRNRVPIKKEIATLLLCAILSDTLNLRSGTTTHADRFAVALLTSFAEVDDVDILAMSLFQAKTNWIVGLGSYEMVRGDQKNFVVDNVRYSIAVLEVTSMEAVLKVSEELLTQLRVFKHEKGDITDRETGEKKHVADKECHCALLFVVDTVQQCSVGLICGARELHIAKKAFPDAEFRQAIDGVRAPSDNVPPENTLCDVKGLVSRKLEFKPMVEAAVTQGVPDWFTITSASQARLNKVLSSDRIMEPHHNSVQVEWDKVMLQAAVFHDTADAALIMDILQEG